MVVCGQLKKFSALYTSFLRRALDLPQQTSNFPLLNVAKMPSPVQIAAHYISKSYSLITERYSSVSKHLRALSDEMTAPAGEYRMLDKASSAVKKITERSYIVDLVHSDEFFGKNLLGLAAGTFLNLRVKHGELGDVGALKSCPKCLIPTTQEHFLDICPSNSMLRREMIDRVPPNFEVRYLADNKFSLRFRNIRQLEVSIRIPPQNLDIRESFSAFGLLLGRAALSAANDFVSYILSFYTIKGK